MPIQARDATVQGSDSTFIDFLNQGPPGDMGPGGGSKAAKMLGYDSKPPSSPYSNTQHSLSHLTDTHVSFARPNTKTAPTPDSKHEFGLEGVSGVHLPSYESQTVPPSRAGRDRYTKSFWSTTKGRVVMGVGLVLLCGMVVGLVAGITFGERTKKDKNVQEKAESTQSPPVANGTFTAVA